MFNEKQNNAVNSETLRSRVPSSSLALWAPDIFADDRIRAATRGLRPVALGRRCAAAAGMQMFRLSYKYVNNFIPAIRPMTISDSGSDRGSGSGSGNCRGWRWYLYQYRNQNYVWYYVPIWRCVYQARGWYMSCVDAVRVLCSNMRCSIVFVEAAYTSRHYVSQCSICIYACVYIYIYIYIYI